MQRWTIPSERPASGAGLTLPELVLAVAVLGLMAVVSLGSGQRTIARMRVETAARQLAVGLEQARSAAQHAGQPCALLLSSDGWTQPVAGDLDVALPPCPLRERGLARQVQLRHNLPAALRISSTGLVLDGGTVVLTAAGTDLQRCLVVSLPLGVVRMGRTKAAPGAAPRSADCVVDPAL